MVSHHNGNTCCATTRVKGQPVSENVTHGAAEGEEGLDQLVRREERMPSHQIDESAQSASPPLDELTL